MQSAKLMSDASKEIQNINLYGIYQDCVSQRVPC